MYTLKNVLNTFVSMTLHMNRWWILLSQNNPTQY